MRNRMAGWQREGLTITPEQYAALNAAAAALPEGERKAYLEEHQKPYSLLYTYSLIIALVCGTAGLPHILVRFYTNPDGVAAKRAELGQPICAMLEEALVVSRRLTQIRLGRGAMNLDTEEAEYLFDEEGRPVDARRYPRHDSHQDVELVTLLPTCWPSYALDTSLTIYTRKSLKALNTLTASNGLPVSTIINF